MKNNRLLNSEDKSAEENEVLSLLHSAGHEGKPPVIPFLLDHGFDVNVASQSHNQRGCILVQKWDAEEIMASQPHPKSDVAAKQAYKAHLEGKKIYKTVRIAKSPSDIIATTEQGVDHYFEIKYTKRTPEGGKPYFGAATIAEWEAALAHGDTFWFVIAIETAAGLLFREYTPKEFLSISNIPPFKIYFTYDLKNGGTRPKRTKSRRATAANIGRLVDLYNELKRTPNDESD